MGLTKMLANKVANYNSSNSLGARFRANRLKHLIKIVENYYVKFGYVSIVDIGGTRNYWKILSENFIKDKNITITIVNLPGVNPKDDEEHFKYVDGDACSLSEFEENLFHVAHSNSVIEHIGNWNNMVLYAKEIRRVATSYFVQTPNFWFPIEPHLMAPFFHWLPEPVKVTLVMNISFANRNKCESIDEAMKMVQSINLLDQKEYKELFKDGIHIREKIFFFTKSLIVIRE